MALIPTTIQYLESIQAGKSYRTQMLQIEKHIIDSMRYALTATKPQPMIIPKEDWNMVMKAPQLKTRDEVKSGFYVEEQNSLECRNWEFEVAHPECICYREILESISRDNPVAFVTHSVDVVTEREIKVKKRVKVEDKFQVLETIKIVKETHKDIIGQVAFVHGSIIAKAELINPEFIDNVLSTRYFGVFELRLTEGMTVQSVTQWVRNIKNAEWGVHADRESIRVVIPKI